MERSLHQLLLFSPDRSRKDNAVAGPKYHLRRALNQRPSGDNLFARMLLQCPGFLMMHDYRMKCFVSDPRAHNSKRMAVAG
jgi:hypothetical protein